MFLSTVKKGCNYYYYYHAKSVNESLHPNFLHKGFSLLYSFGMVVSALVKYWYQVTKYTIFLTQSQYI